MSLEYAEDRIREALRLCKNNAARARQQVIAWTFEDTKLLQALARPHLTGIVAHAVSRTIHRQEAEEHAEDAPPVPETLDMAPDTFGKEILKALQSENTARFGREGAAPPPARRRQASQRHIDAIRQMSKKKDE